MENKTQRRQAEHMDGAIDDKIVGGGPPAVVAGIGAGAGALKSLKTILGGLPTGRGIAVVLIHHSELTKKNLFKLLKGHTALEIVEATDGMAILADRIYVMPPDKFLSIAQDRLVLTAPVHCDGLLMPIDHFFCSLADDRRNRCCGILLSGSGGDGTLGLSEIRAASGRTIAEDPKNAKFPDMQQHAIEAGVADAVLPAEAIAGAITELAGQMIAAARNDKAASLEADADLRVILDILRARIGHDFRCYKPSTLLRRIHRRMTLGKIATMDDYARHLSDHPDEVGLLQKDLLIGVTDFFRQPSAWETLEKRVIAPLMESAREGAEIRIWVPGCASGKEVYSLAMLLTEEVERSGRKTDFQIFATDTDLASLAMARTGSYPAEEIGENVSVERIKRFFVRRDGHYQVIKSIRERVVFAAQNITADPPFSRLDLTICRNLLIYLDQQIQKRIIALFHFALRDGGFLFLGNAETVGDREDLFEPISKKWRIYRRIGVGHRVNVEIPARPTGDCQPALFKPPAAVTPRQSLASMAQQTLLERFAPACVMIDRKLQVLYVHGLIENYLTIPAGELTTRVVDMAREGLRVRLRGAIVKCIETGRPVPFTARARRGEKSVPVKATVSPLRHLRETNGLLLITFEDQRIPDAVKSCRAAGAEDDIRQLADELKITREELQSTIDQLEGSNDQLKASNEEVMAANEELQSANEEMETSKEELQSLNEELNTINIRLQEKVDELESTNNDVVNLLASTSIATLFLDKGFKIKRFTPAITGLMSLIPTDLGRPIGDILMRFTDEALLDDARRVLVDLAPLSREVQDDEGRWYIRRIMPYRTRDDRIEGVVLTFVDVTDLKKVQEDLGDSQRRIAVIMDSIADGFFAIDREWRFTHINDAALRHFGKTRDEMLGRKLLEVFPAAHGTTFETGYRHALGSEEPVHFEAPSTIADRMMEIHAYPGQENLTVLFRDVTERYRMVQALREAHERVAWLARFPEENPNPVLRASADGYVLYTNPAAARQSVWASVVGDPLPVPLRPLVAQAMARGEEIQQDVRWGDRIFGVSITPFPAESYANIYGRDITKRTLAEAALRASELKAATLLNAADESIWLFGLDGDVLAANTTAARRIGKTVGEVVGMKWADLLDENLRKSRGEKIAEVIRTGEPVHFEDKRADIVFDHAFYPAHDGAGNIMGVAAFSRDTTERKRAEEVLHRYELLAEHGRDIILFVRRDDGRILEANAAALSLYGYGRDQLLSRLIQDLRAEGTKEVMADQIAEADTQGILFETVHKRNDGSTFPVEVSSRGTTIGGVRILVSIIRDISIRKQTEEALRKSEEHLRLHTENSPTAIVGWDADFIVTRWAGDAEKIFGWSTAETVGKPIMDLHMIYEEDIPIVEKTIGRLTDGVSRQVVSSNRNRTKNGQVIHCEWYNSVLLDADGKMASILSQVLDVTKRKNAEESALRQSELLGGINRILNAALHSATEEELGKTCLAVVEEITGSGIGFIGEIGADGLLHVIAISNPGWEACRMADSAGQRRLPGSFEIHGIYGRVLRDGKAFFTNDPVSHPDRLGTPPGHPPLASFLGAPFLSEGRVVGMIAVGNREAGYGTPQLEALEALAPIIREAFQRKRAEEALEASRAATEREKKLLETVMEALPVGVAITDAKGGNIKANRAFEQVWGGPRPPADSVTEYASYKAWWAETGESVRPEEWASAQAVQRGKAVSGQLLEIRRFDGSRAFVLNSASPVLDAEGKIAGSAVAIQDITALRRTEEALRESEERLKLFIEHAPAALAMFDREMRYLSVSHRWRSDYGLGERTLSGLSHYEVFPEISGEWREAHRRGLAGEVLRAEADRFKRADGSVQWVYWEIHPWRDTAGAVGGIVIFTEDITERKRAEEVLKERTRQLEAANRELEGFSYSVSHDLRAPLRAIDGYSRMILRKHADRFDEDALGKFNVIRDNTQMMGQLIDDLLAFSRLGKTQLSAATLDIEGLIREIWEELKTINPDRRLTLKYAEIPPCRGDRGLIKQVLVNILSNAVKFTRGRGEALIEAGGYNKNGEIVYYVRDNGVGFDMQYHDKMFGVFQRLHSAEEFEGTGVGLAIVQRIIHRHGGRIWAEGEIDRGACFFFTLPG